LRPKRIVARTAKLLNTQGYLGTTVSEIMRVAGLQKGGIYRHFESRAALTREAFEYAVGRLRDRLLDTLEGKKTATARLFALFEVVRNAPHEDWARIIWRLTFFSTQSLMNSKHSLESPIAK
jgi:AcrR family transcriptional regulator